ncbi:MAG: SRPBCC family protein [Burkholderiaceae bacterium]|nr:SRPBCC family protein [Burkholderiaceae bacterium]
MKILKFLLGLVVLLAAAVFGGALLIDPAYEVSRSVQVQAAPEKIYPLVDSSAGWSRWGVWYQRDPQMKVTETGAARGAGAAWSWTSESQGNGAMTLTAAEPPQRVAYELRIDGFAPSQGDLTLVPDGAATRVTWRMHGTMDNLLGRWFGLFMERLVGPDFDAGLANLKALAEQPA